MGFVTQPRKIDAETQLENLAPAVESATTGAASTVIDSNLTANRVAIANANGKLSNSNVTSTELNVIDGNTAASSVTLADADRVVVNDNGTMKQVAMTKLADYIKSELSPVKVIYAGKITGINGNIATTTVGSFTSSRASQGRYTVSSLSISDVNRISIDCYSGNNSWWNVIPFDITTSSIEFRTQGSSGGVGDVDFFFRVLEY